MNTRGFFMYLMVMLAAAFSIATSSIGIQCYTDPNNTGYKTESNKTFMIVNLVLAIIVLLSCLSMFYVAIRPELPEMPQLPRIPQFSQMPRLTSAAPRLEMPPMYTPSQ